MHSSIPVLMGGMFKGGSYISLESFTPKHPCPAYRRAWCWRCWAACARTSPRATACPSAATSTSWCAATPDLGRASCCGHAPSHTLYFSVLVVVHFPLASSSSSDCGCALHTCSLQSHDTLSSTARVYKEGCPESCLADACLTYRQHAPVCSSHDDLLLYKATVRSASTLPTAGSGRGSAAGALRLRHSGERSGAHRGGGERRADGRLRV